MSAKSITIAVAGLLVVGGTLWYVLRSKAAAAPQASSPAAVAKEAPESKKAATLAAPPVPTPANAAPAVVMSEHSTSSLKVIDNPAGPIFVDLETKTLSQTRKVLVRQGRGKLKEIDMQITARPVQNPTAVTQRQATTNVKHGAPGGGTGPKKKKKGSGAPQPGLPPKPESDGSTPAPTPTSG